MLTNIIFILSVVSCSAGKNITGDYVIRYINLNAVYNYMYNSSNEAQEIKRKTDSLNKKIDEMENSTANVSKSELAYYKGEVSKLKEQEKKLKSECYLKIKTALNNIAAKHNADFIFNTGEGMVYSKPAYDVTNEVISEIKSLEVRTSPVYK